MPSLIAENCYFLKAVKILCFFLANKDYIMKKRNEKKDFFYTKCFFLKAKFFLQQDSYQTYPNNRPQNQVVCFRPFDTAVVPNSYCFDVSMYTWKVSNAFAASLTIQLTIVP